MPGCWRSSCVAFDPNLIAHAALITTDTATVLLTLATLYTLSRYLRARPASVGRAGVLVLTGVLLGLAQLAKVSALLLVPVTGLLLFLGVWEKQRAFWLAVAIAAVRAGFVVAIAAFVLWAGYGFEVSAVDGWPIPMPAATHLKIFQSLNEHYQLGHPTFALGRVNTQGWAWYFPLAFAVKTPLPVLLLALTALVVAIRKSRTGTRNLSSPQVPGTPEGPRHREGWLIALFPLLYAATSLFSSVNIGYRHLLPVLPFMAIGIGVTLARRGSRARTVALAALLLWLAAGTLRTLPYPLTYFNELAGGPSNGYRTLVDSNLDWGQNLWDLEAWMAEHGEARVAYAHFSPAQLAPYGIDADYLPPDPRAVAFAPWRPAPGLYAIGATVLQGPYAPDLNTYAWFRDREPEARLGHALFVYRVQEQDAPSWALLCAPVTDAGGVRRRVGIEGLRVVQPICDQALVYPAGTGLTLLQPDAGFPTVGEPLLSIRTAGGVVAAELRTASGEAVVPQIPAPASARFDGPLTYLGYAIPSTLSQAWTYWHVDAVPARPLSLMAHLVAADGAVVAVGDGDGFPARPVAGGRRHRAAACVPDDRRRGSAADRWLLAGYVTSNGRPPMAETT